MSDSFASDPHRLLAALREQERRELADHLQQRRRAFDGVRDALLALEEAPSPGAILERAPAELGHRVKFASVLTSAIREGALTEFCVWQAGPPETTTPWSELAVRLAYPLVEDEIVRGGAAKFVRVADSGRRTPQILRERLGWSAYTSTAVSVNGHPRWMIHAEPVGDDPQEADLLTETLAAFACSLGRMIEIVSLRGLLRAVRDQQLQTARAIVERIEATSIAPPAPFVETRERDRDSLTAREHQVLGLLTEGMTNQAVAQQLLVSEGTVKYHVANVLRKLGATSRADAVARYMREQARDVRA